MCVLASAVDIDLLTHHEAVTGYPAGLRLASFYTLTWCHENIYLCMDTLKAKEYHHNLILIHMSRDPHSQDTSPIPFTDSIRVKKSGPSKVKSVSEFIAKIIQSSKGEVGKKKGDATIFYRGHADVDWKLVPSILRDPELIKREHLLFRDMVAHEPQSFLECKSALDYLVQMQHYGLPTRLLDVTMNPLIALYLACKETSDDLPARVAAGFREGAKLGQKLAIHAIKKSGAELCGKTGDNPRIRLAVRAGAVAGAVAGLGIDFKDTVLAAALSSAIFGEEPGVEEEDKRLVELAAKAGATAGATAGAKVKGKDGVVYLFSIPENEVKHYDSDDVSVLANLAKCEISAECCSSSPSPEFSEQPDILSLIDQVQGEKLHFKSSVTLDRLTSLFFVKAKNGNQRITNQMGAFLIFGLGLTSVDEGFKGPQYLTKILYPEVPAAWIKEKFIIPRECKADILKELELLGITESYIYPGMEQYAKDLKKHYNIKD